MKADWHLVFSCICMKFNLFKNVFLLKNVVHVEECINYICTV